VNLGFPKTAIVLMDSEINIGPNRANKFFQKQIGMHHRKRNGRMDVKTFDRLSKIPISDEDLCEALISERREFYARLVKRNSVYARYHNGWNNRLDDIHKFVNEN